MKAQVNSLSARRSKLRGKQDLLNLPQQQGDGYEQQGGGYQQQGGGYQQQQQPSMQSLMNAIQAIQRQLREMQQPVFFNVYRTLEFQGYGRSIPYDHMRLNVGMGMDIRTGVFTAPKSGTYLFLFTGYSIYLNTQVNIRKNGRLMLATAFHDQGDDSRGGVLSTQTSVYLRVGETVDAFLVSGEIFDDEIGFFTQFTGMLVSQDFSAGAAQIRPPRPNLLGNTLKNFLTGLL